MLEKGTKLSQQIQESEKENTFDLDECENDFNIFKDKIKSLENEIYDKQAVIFEKINIIL